MLELHVTDTNVSGGSIKVSWCLTKEALDALTHRSLKDPYIVFCVAPYDDSPLNSRYSEYKESRKAVPLKDMIAYLEFFCSGQNRIWAWLASSKKAASRYLQKSNGSYDFSVLNNVGTDYRNWDLDRMCLFGPVYLSDTDIKDSKEGRFEDDGPDSEKKIVDYSGTSLAKPVSVYVPEGCFAPEPAQWEKTWVNHFFPNKCVDQCSFRRRRLFAYTLQPVMMIGNLLLRFLIFVFALLFGARDLSLKYLLHPLTYALTDSFEMFLGGTIFVLRTRHRVLNFLPLVFMPYVLAGLFALYMAKVLLLVLLVVSVVSGVLFLAFHAARAHLGERFVSWLENLSDSDPELWYANEEEQNLILCTGEVKPVKLSALPARHRTIKLRFYDLKSKICRPFSK